MKAPVLLKSRFNEFKGLQAYFEEHLLTTASENL